MARRAPFDLEDSIVAVGRSASRCRRRRERKELKREREEEKRMLSTPCTGMTLDARDASSQKQ